MNIIITMAGLGSRFRKAGYTVPKYMIEVKGKTLFEWSMLSLEDFKNEENKFIYVVMEDEQNDAKKFIEDSCMISGIKNYTIVTIDYLTDGQASTAVLALPYCNKGEGILIYNIDTYVEPYEMKESDIRGDGFIPCFIALGEHWSFAKADGNGLVSEVREKKRISDNCTLGAYYFSSPEVLKKVYDEYYADTSNMEKGEKYVAPLYNHMIKSGYEVYCNIINADKVHVLGTPEEVELFARE